MLCVVYNKFNLLDPHILHISYVRHGSYIVLFDIIMTKDLTVINKENLGGWSISFEMVSDIYSKVPIGSTILEFGSGNGTKELLKLYNVISIEHDITYIGYAVGSQYIYAPMTDLEHPVVGFKHINKWYDIERIRKGLENKKYDCIIIDGPHGSWKKNQGRPGILNYISEFNTNVPIYVDDIVRANKVAHGEDELKLANHLSKLLNKKLKLTDRFAILD